MIIHSDIDASNTKLILLNENVVCYTTFVKRIPIGLQHIRVWWGPLETCDILFGAISHHSKDKYRIELLIQICRLIMNMMHRTLIIIYEYNRQPVSIKFVFKDSYKLTIV